MKMYNRGSALASARSSRISKAVSRADAARKSVIAKRRFGDLTAAIRESLKRDAEQKMKFITGGNVAIYSNGTILNDGNLYPFVTNALTTDIGNTQFTRNGDQIHSQYLDVKLNVSQDSAGFACGYRVIVVRGEASDMPNAATTGLFMAGSYPGSYVHLGKVNTDKFYVMKDFVINPYPNDYSIETGSSLVGHGKVYKFRIPIGRRVTYKDDAGTVPKGSMCINMFVIGFDGINTGITTRVGTLTFSVTHYFKDL